MGCNEAAEFIAHAPDIQPGRLDLDARSRSAGNNAQHAMSSQRGWTSIVDLLQKPLWDAEKRGSLEAVEGARVDFAVRKW